ncbi:sensor domain-containing diguanylate cyclase [Fervidobacterium thailandense]|uniref:GGDEF domain-containing protein n=1 Tax=Fervidobacterium thailandense TaxID=1008305 RepID=A0A1E3G1L2_9BACT|nr:sensor domain-containing diguanylate cyclase [Fervidobacterium thailandense]ODN30147.1 hypothetical protein A4H02_06890 [Fervidobacterium thailandense]
MNNKTSAGQRYAIFLILLVVVISILGALLIHTQLKEQRLEIARRVFVEQTEFFATSISLSFFQWDDMYYAVLNGRDDFLKKYFSQIREHFKVTDIKIVDEEPPRDIYEIRGEVDKLIIRFKIFDSETLKFVPSKTAVIEIPASTVTRNILRIGLRFTTDGKPLAYGLKVKLTVSRTEILMFLLLFSTLTVGLLVILVLSKAKSAREHFELARSLEIQKKSLSAINEFTNEILRGVLEPSYQYLIERAVEIVPGAQAGSILVRDGDEFTFAGCVGYDFEQLKQVRFKPHQLAQGMDGKVKIITNLGDYDAKHLDDEKQLETLKNVGQINKIRAMLSIPIIIRGQIVGFMNLDNFEDEKAFSKVSIEIANIFANQVGVLFERIALERELKKQKEQFEYLSTHDELTGLPNRRLLEEHAEKMLALARRERKQVCVLYLDLKKFKPVNDTYGHKVGDYVLKIVAKRLENTVRKSDIVARIGGDEFGFVLYDCKEYMSFVERLISEIEKDIYYEYVKINISGNFGITTFPEDGSDFEDLLIKADKAMYYAKTNGLKYFCYRNLPKT